MGGRLHCLREIEDMPWLPAALRDAVTAFLRTVTARRRPFDAAGPVLASLLPLSSSPGPASPSPSSSGHIVDLCSGGGGALVDLMRRPGLLPADCRALLTDLYPNAPAYAYLESQLPGRVKGVREPVDASSVPRSLKGVRTLFNALHHLDPRSVESCMRDSADANEPFAAFEVVERHPLALLAMLGVMPFLPLVLTPFTRPFKASTLFFTYLVPLVPLLVTVDGFLSCLRAYSIQELEGFCARAKAERASRGEGGAAAAAYEWSVGAAPRTWGGLAPFRLVWLVGRPAAVGGGKGDQSAELLVCARAGDGDGDGGGGGGPP